MTITEWSHDDNEVRRDFFKKLDDMIEKCSPEELEKLANDVMCTTFKYQVKPWVNAPMAGRTGELVDYQEGAFPVVLKFSDPVEGEHVFAYKEDQVSALYNKVYPY